MRARRAAASPRPSGASPSKLLEVALVGRQPGVVAKQVADADRAAALVPAVGEGRQHVGDARVEEEPAARDQVEGQRRR